MDGGFSTWYTSLAHRHLHLSSAPLVFCLSPNWTIMYWIFLILAEVWADFPVRREFFERGTVKQETYMLQTRPAHAKCPMLCEAFLSENMALILAGLYWYGFYGCCKISRQAGAWKLLTLFGMKIDKHLNFTCSQSSDVNMLWQWGLPYKEGWYLCRPKRTLM